MPEKYLKINDLNDDARNSLFNDFLNDRGKRYLSEEYKISMHDVQCIVRDMCKKIDPDRYSSLFDYKKRDPYFSELNYCRLNFTDNFIHIRSIEGLSKDDICTILDWFDFFKRNRRISEKEYALSEKLLCEIRTHSFINNGDK